MRFRLRKLALLILFGALTALLVHFLAGAYTEQHVPLPGRGGHGRSVTRTAEPAMFWASVVAIAVFCLGTLGGALMNAWELVTGKELG